VLGGAHSCGTEAVNQTEAKKMHPTYVFENEVGSPMNAVKLSK
jgi:hypothetical protein